MRVKIKIKKDILLVLTLFISSQALGMDKFYYSYAPRSLEVNSKEETLLVFPAPPVAVVCQPSNVVQVLPVEKLSESQMFSLPQASEYLEGIGGGGAGASDGNKKLNFTKPPTLSNFLKVVPLQEGATSCAFRLSTAETVRLNLKLKEEIQRPIVELKSFYSENRSKREIENSDLLNFEYQDAVSVFKDFVVGGKLTSFKDLSSGSSDSNTTKESKVGEYKIIYYGSDKRYSGFIVAAVFREDRKKLPKFKNVKLGELYFSSLIEEDKKRLHKNPKSIEKDKTYYFYVLARADISQKEILEVMP